MIALKVFLIKFLYPLAPPVPSHFLLFSFAIMVVARLSSVSVLNFSGLAITGNRKNTDEHIVLLGWSLGDEKNDVAVVEINRDKWLPRIELQGS